MDISITKALAFGWKATKKNYIKVLLSLVILLALNLTNSLLNNLHAESFKGFMPTNPVNFVIYIIGFAIIQSISLIIIIGITKEGLKIVRGHEGEVKNIPEHIHLFWKVLLGQFLYGAILIGALLILTVPFVGIFIVASHSSQALAEFVIVIGLLLMIIATIYITITFIIFGRMLIIDKEIHPFRTLELGRELTKNKKIRLAGIMMILIFVNIIGIMLLGVGLLITLPVTFFAFLHIYEQLLKRMSPGAFKAEVSELL